MRKIIAFLILVVLGITLYFVTGNLIEKSLNKDYEIEGHEIKKENIIRMAENDYYNLLSKIRDLQRTPDQIIDFNAMVMEVMYSGNLKDEEIKLLVKLQREYYSPALLKNNPEHAHIQKALDEIKDYKNKSIKIIGYKRLSSPEYVGSKKDRAIIKALFYRNSGNADIYQNYYLLQNSIGLWEIVGWTHLDNITKSE